MTIEKEVREYLTHIYLCPKARYDKYLPLLDQKRGDWWGWFTTETQPDWIVLSVSFADEQLQNRFMAEPDVICLPHQTESAPCCSATVSKLAEMGLADAPTTSTEAFLDWAIENGHSVGSFTDQLQRRARLRVLRHSQARLAKSASVGESV